MDMQLIDAAFEEEIQKVSHLDYDSNLVCRQFYKNLRARVASALPVAQSLTVDALAQEIRRVDGSNTLGAGALAESLMPFLSAALPVAQGEAVEYDSGLFQRAYAKGYRAALGAAAAECRRLAMALDNGGNEYVRYPEFLMTALKVSGLRVPGAYGDDLYAAPPASRIAELERQVERLREALADLIGAVRHLNPCPATLEKAEALAAQEKK